MCQPMPLLTEIFLRPGEVTLDDSKDLETHINPNLLTLERGILTKFHFIKALNLIILQK